MIFFDDRHFKVSFQPNSLLSENRNIYLVFLISFFSIQISPITLSDQFCFSKFQDDEENNFWIDFHGLGFFL